MNDTSRVCRFKVGEWIVDIDRGGIFQGKNFTRLEPKPMSLLVCLAHANGAVISVAELKEKVWSETHVVDDVVKRGISQIRVAFGDDARRQQVIATTPKRGYRIVAKIDWNFEEEPETVSPARILKQHWVAGVVAMAIGLIAAGTILNKPSPSQTDGLAASGSMDQLSTAYTQAQIYYDSYEYEDNESAIAIYRRIIVEHPDQAAAYAGLANAILQRVIRWSEPGDLMEEAKDAALTALELDPFSPQAFKALGLYHQELKQFPEAIDAYQNALEISPHYWAAVNNVGEVYREVGNLSAANEWLTCALQISSNKEQSLAALGELNFRLGNYETSRRYFNDALILAPYSPDSLIGLSYLALYNDEPQSALGYCARLAEVWPNIQDCKLNSGIASLLLGDIDRARTIFRSLSQDDSPYWKVVGNIRLYQLDTMNSSAATTADKAANLYLQADQSRTEGLLNKQQASWLKALVASADSDTDAAIGFLYDAVASGHRESRWDMIEPGFAALRSDIRFIELMKQSTSLTGHNGTVPNSDGNYADFYHRPDPKSCDVSNDSKS